ncbi:hypothetical protein BJ138DRAFT_1129162 [Hygrophoropsis aurantiaca]|uniref:Uncharacterized protein n=1 Tax=Hygrophoropsis aurantiaca TaxID=72124 RepID=A0ACB8A214_9AGAM|nr:hypothetical protein BJ138DRAFT_1129162 [Hygrophoropsis aurantiaca]
MFHIIFWLSLWTAIFPPALCGLYPTKPIQNTVYEAGTPVLTTWVDDKTYPRIDTLDPLEIQLFCDDDTYITTLATGVDPKSLSYQFTIPPNLVYSGSNFTIRFIPNTAGSDLIIYTADFTIAMNSQANSSSASSHSVTSSLASSSSTAIPPTTYTAPPLRPGDIGYVPKSQQQKSAGRRIDIEKVKFRLVFILWPALIGITMAL